MSIIEEWFEIPAGRRHWYFYGCLLLFAVAMQGFQDPPAAEGDPDAQLLAQAIELKDAPPLQIESCPVPNGSAGKIR
jgi:hypothetical protein